MHRSIRKDSQSKRSGPADQRYPGDGPPGRVGVLRNWSGSKTPVSVTEVRYRIRYRIGWIPYQNILNCTKSRPSTGQTEHRRNALETSGFRRNPAFTSTRLQNRRLQTLQGELEKPGSQKSGPLVCTKTPPDSRWFCYSSPTNTTLVPQVVFEASPGEINCPD